MYLTVLLPGPRGSWSILSTQEPRRDRLTFQYLRTARGLIRKRKRGGMTWEEWRARTTNVRAPEATRPLAGRRHFHVFSYEDAPALVQQTPSCCDLGNNRLRVFASCRVPELVAREPPPFFFPRLRASRVRRAASVSSCEGPAASRERICFAFR